MVDIPQSGRPAFLTEEEQVELVQDVLRSPRDLGFDYSNWMLKIIVEHVKRKYDKEMTISGVWRILRRQNMTRIVPRPMPAKADPQKNKSL